MTRYNYATALAKFDACGYSTTCKLMGVEGDLFIAKCRECGHEFTRNNVILRKPQKKLRCPECHERNVAAMLEWYASGHSIAECAERFGVTKAQVTNYAASRGVHGGMSRDKLDEVSKRNLAKASTKGNAVKTKRAAPRIRSNVTLHGFEMLNEWHGPNEQYQVRCMRCGHEFELAANTVKACKFKCPKCKDAYDEIRESTREWGKAVKAIIRMAKETTAVLDNLDAWITGEYSWHKDTLAAHEPQVATCRFCGGRWVHWPTTTQGGYRRRVPPAYCSKKCRRRANKQPSNIGKRLRKHGTGNMPREVIHLRDLYERDGGICQICGKPCSWDDYTRTSDGAFWYINGRYPTIDHIVAIANGGTHTWNNVQLACRDCNSAKGAGIIDTFGARQRSNEG